MVDGLGATVAHRVSFAWAYQRHCLFFKCHTELHTGKHAVLSLNYVLHKGTLGSRILLHSNDYICRFLLHLGLVFNFVLVN